MNEEKPDLSTSEVKPGKIGGSQVHMVPTGHMTKVVHKVVDKATNPASTPHQPMAGYGVTVRKAGTGEIIDFKEDIAPAKAFIPRVPQDIIKVPKRHPFEAYWTGLTNKTDAIDVFVAWGTVCQTNPSTNTAFSIASESLDKLWTLNIDEYIWLEADFTAAGNLITLKMKCGVPASNGWTSFPNSYASGSTTLGNYWYHPIAHFRTARTSKSTVNALTGNPFRDSGEELAEHATYTIAQLTNTHLVALQVCEYINGVSQQMLWKLTPGPGAVTGTGS